MENINGLNAKFIITVGSLRLAAGELADQPGQYRVRAHDLNEDALICERSFDKLSYATGFLCDAAFPRSEEQRE